MNLKSRIFIFVARCIGVIATSMFFTPILAGFAGIVIDIYIYFRYGHTFNVLDEYLFFCIQGHCARCDYWDIRLYNSFI